MATQMKVKAERVAASQDQKKALKSKRKVIFKRAEKYAKEYRALERDEIRYKRIAKSKDNFYVPAQAKLAFVIRIRGINQVSPKVKSPSASPSPSNKQWGVCQAKQVYLEHASIGRALHCLGIP